MGGASNNGGTEFLPAARNRPLCGACARGDER
jgi:hypothetical protein